MIIVGVIKRLIKRVMGQVIQAFPIYTQASIYVHVYVYI